MPWWVGWQPPATYCLPALYFKIATRYCGEPCEEEDALKQMLYSDTSKTKPWLFQRLIATAWLPHISRGTIPPVLLFLYFEITGFCIPAGPRPWTFENQTIQSMVRPPPWVLKFPVALTETFTDVALHVGAFQARGVKVFKWGEKFTPHIRKAGTSCKLVLAWGRTGWY